MGFLFGSPWCLVGPLAFCYWVTRIKKLKLGSNTMNLIEENVEATLELTGPAKDFLNRIPGSQA